MSALEGYHNLCAIFLSENLHLYKLLVPEPIATRKPSCVRLYFRIVIGIDGQIPWPAPKSVAPSATIGIEPSARIDIRTSRRKIEISDALGH
jgi:hypothetical protein